MVRFSRIKLLLKSKLVSNIPHKGKTEKFELHAFCCQRCSPECIRRLILEIVFAYTKTPTEDGP